jgi:membrane protease YdiL (CAAX protease family)
MAYFVFFIVVAWLLYYGTGPYRYYSNYGPLFAFDGPMALIGMFGSLFVINSFVLMPKRAGIEFLVITGLTFTIFGLFAWITLKPSFSFLLAELVNVAVLAPFCEEIFYRLFLLNVLFRATGIKFLSARKTLRWAIAIIIDCLIFMAGHFEVYSTTPLIQLVTGIFVPSVGWTIFFVWGKNLSVPIAIHSTINIIGFTWLYLLI